MDKLPVDTTSNVSPGIRSRMSIKTIKIKNNASQGIPLVQIPNIFKLRNDYQVYLIQVS